MAEETLFVLVDNFDNAITLSYPRGSIMVWDSMSKIAQFLWDVESNPVWAKKTRRCIVRQWTLQKIQDCAKRIDAGRGLYMNYRLR